ncbi:hypothetical protein E4A48_01285 [Xanthomonas cerealis pv. cerealis]|uniref:Uncharacterized protein n=1 Tax=Xanthomonas cerealis pv. cerealis TaxID=152263 RepID=A0A514E9Q6_9XANT|nr:hypothetical protein [Xanthomonas translucens]QDI02513.1 hypothetical protein E4A48_01285 [Xanthomonas translucens pv. cerealis]
MNYPSPVKFIAAIDKSLGSASGSVIREAFQIKEFDLRPIIEGVIGEKEFVNKSLGIQLEFEDAGLREPSAYHDVGEGPWILTHAVFRAGLNGSPRYRGEIPYGVRFELSRQQIKEFLGEPSTSNIVADVWDKGSHRLVVNYDVKSQEVKLVGLQAPIRE